MIVASDPDRVSAADIPIEGSCDPAFAAVADAFRENFRSRGEIGGAVCVQLDGRAVVDLWGGHCEAERLRPWHRDTLVNAYSVGKGITSMLALSLVERGELDLDRPVARDWPGFAENDKGATTLRMLLAHQGGLPAVRRPLADSAIYDWGTMTAALAEQAPYWAPGSAHGYHVNTHGFLVGEPIVRRLGRTFGECLRVRVTGPVGADFHSALPPREHARVATLAQDAPPPPPTAAGSSATLAGTAIALPASLATGDPAIDALLPAVYFNPPGFSGSGTVNTPEWRSASIPSTNSHATARAVATLYDVFLRRDVSQGGLVGPGLRAEARRTQAEGPDRVLGKPSRFGLGFQLSQPTRRIGGGGDCFGHYGYGGSLGFADPDCGLAFGYLMNRPGERWYNPRTVALVEAVYAALGRPLAPLAL
jgi:CubicO group peptidase (beta-lactamase class C family)